MEEWNEASKQVESQPRIIVPDRYLLLTVSKLNLYDTAFQPVSHYM